MAAVAVSQTQLPPRDMQGALAEQQTLANVSSAGQSSVVDGPILFFDGNCGLCQGSVQFMLNRDRRGRIRYAPLQGTTAARIVERADREDLSSMVVSINGQLYRHSTAVLLLLRELGGVWSILATLGLLIPRPLRDFCYRLVARNRYRLFGTVEACRIPKPGERARFLD